MPLGPRPANFTTSGEDAELIVTVRGRCGVNVFTPGERAIDTEWRRHKWEAEEADLFDPGSGY